MEENGSIHETIMKKTCDLANEHIDTGSGPFACIITDASGNIIGNGCNMVTLHNDPTSHAEIVAIRDACQNLNTFNLHGKILYTSCEPCPMCLSAIYWARIDKVYYGNDRADAKNIGFDDSYIYDEVSKKSNDRNIEMTQLCQTYANRVFRKWDKKTDKIEY